MLVGGIGNAIVSEGRNDTGGKLPQRFVGIERHGDLIGHPCQRLDLTAGDVGREARLLRLPVELCVVDGDRRQAGDLFREMQISIVVDAL